VWRDAGGALVDFDFISNTKERITMSNIFIMVLALSLLSPMVLAKDPKPTDNEYAVTLLDSVAKIKLTGFFKGGDLNCLDLFMNIGQAVMNPKVQKSTNWGDEKVFGNLVPLKQGCYVALIMGETGSSNFSEIAALLDNKIISESFFLAYIYTILSEQIRHEAVGKFISDNEKTPIVDFSDKLRKEIDRRHSELPQVMITNM
jgi:hypothetical protein